MNTKAPIRYLNKTCNKVMLKVIGHLPRSLPCKQVLEDELLPREMGLISVRDFSCSCATLSEYIVSQNTCEDVLSVFPEWVYGAENNADECLVRQQYHYLWNLMQRIFLYEANLPFCTFFNIVKRLSWPYKKVKISWSLIYSENSSVKATVACDWWCSLWW